MMTARQVSAALGFGFVAMWIATNLGYAVLCLVGAAVFYLAAGVAAGEIDLSEWQARLGPRAGAGDSYPTGSMPPPRRTRVQ